MAGCIYMGTFFTYLEGEGRFPDMTSSENMITVLAILFFVMFLLAAAAYILFEKKGGGHAKILGVF